MIRLFSVIWHPLFIIMALTLGPFTILLIDSINEQSWGLSRAVGVNTDVYLYAVMGVLATTIGYTFTSLCLNRNTIYISKPNTDYTTSEQHLWRTSIICVLLFAIVGLAIVVLPVGGEYVSNVFSNIGEGAQATEMLVSPEEWSIATNQPGIVRMLGYWTVGAFVLWLGIALAQPRWAGPTHQFVIVLFLLFGFLGVRTVIAASRIPAMTSLALAFYVMYYLAYKKSELRIQNRGQALKNSIIALLIGVVLLFVGVRLFESVNMLRGIDRLGGNPIVTYSDQGLANASIAMTTTTQYSLGFSTIFAPLTFVPRAFGLDIEFPSSDRDWVKSPASNLLTYIYSDFGFFGIFEYAAIGSLCIWLRKKRSDEPVSIFWSTAYLWLLFALLTIWTVPISGGPDFWAAVLASLTIARRLDSYSVARRSPFIHQRYYRLRNV